MLQDSGGFWAINNVRYLRAAIIPDAPTPGIAGLEEALRLQIASRQPEVIRLAAEMMWMLFLFPRSLAPKRKRELIGTVWGWSKAKLDLSNSLLSDAVMAGVGDAGRAFNTHRDREFEALVEVTIALKEAGSSITSISPRQFGELIDRVPKAAGRKIRNMLLHLYHPDHYEPIASNTHKRQIVRGFADLLPDGEQPKTKPLIEVDDQLLVIRRKLQERSPDRQVDFYDPLMQAVWNPPAEAAPQKKARRPTMKQAASAAEEAARAAEETAKVAEPDLVAQEADVVEKASEVEQSSATEEHPLPEAANDETRAGVWFANELAQRASLPAPTADLLFASLIHQSSDPEYGSPAAAAVNELMAKSLAARGQTLSPAQVMTAHYAVDPNEVTTVQTGWSPGAALSPILDAADQVRTGVGQPRLQPLSPRHILTVLLRPGPHSVTAILRGLGFDPAELRAALLDSILGRRLGEDPVEWRRLLEIDETPTPDVDIYAGFSTDALRTGDAAGITRKDDRLNVMRDVTALAEVLGARDTKPPLAVGLFGDWGTGKSFFMELLRQEIELLGTQNHEFYCNRVVQVWFNAWHYMESNLWASLAARVFEELAEHIETKWALPKDEREELFKQLQQSQGVLAEAVAEREEATRRLSGIQARQNDRRQQMRDAASAALDEAVATLGKRPEIQEALRDAKKRLGLTAAEADITMVVDEARRLRSLGGRIMALARTLWRRPVFLLLGIALFAALTVGATLLIENADFLSGASQVVATAAAWLAAAAVAVAPVALQVSRGVAWIEDVATRLQQRRDSAQRQRELAINNELDRLKEREREAQARVDALNREIEDLRAGRRLQRFILERHTSAEYRQHLGLVNLIRKDFEQLSKLLIESEKESAASPGGDGKKAVATNVLTVPRQAEADVDVEASAVSNAEDQPATGEGAPAGETKPAPLPRIDRIILYIDDLDRCPEERVVQVLQAVHLLLAFPLFVVVVGVDSRWLLLSLEDHYAALRGSSTRTRDEDGKQERKKSESEWSTTPQNYLEKIFQIPFSLRPMESGGFGQLVTSLLPITEEDEETKDDAEATDDHGGTAHESEVDQQQELDSHEDEEEIDAAADEEMDEEEEVVEDESSDGGDEADAADHAGETDAGDGAGGEAKAKAEEKLIAKPNPLGLTISKGERDFIARLHPLIASPRALKRFTNVYRFLRVQQRGAALDRFRGSDGRAGEFEVVALLLGAVVGYPAEAAHLLRAVLANRDAEWWALVEKLSDAGAEEDAKTRAEAAAAAPSPFAEDGRRTLREALLEVKKSVEIGAHTPRTFANWTREVARFSFQSGRILSIRGAEEEEEEPEESPA
ncbi:MAG TPA: P-loop NTPase fold protein [Longimicrobium sp.]